MRPDERADCDPRCLTIQRQYTKYAPGSVLISYGETKVLCTACIEEKVPPFMRDCGKGWLTAEYALLPSATHTRAQREATKGKQTGRTQEIQRLIGRSLRSILDFSKLGERTIHIDADVIQADGGTRTAAITGGMIAVYDAVSYLLKTHVIEESPIHEFLAAVSVGVVQNRVVCDLSYLEDCEAEVDMNVVMTESGRFVEIQGTAEAQPFTQVHLQEMLQNASVAIQGIIQTVKHHLNP